MDNIEMMKKYYAELEALFASRRFGTPEERQETEKELLANGSSREDADLVLHELYDEEAVRAEQAVTLQQMREYIREVEERHA